VNPAAFLARCENWEREASRLGLKRFLDLDRMRILCERFRHPEDPASILVHIAGTKGKGSTAVMTAALLRAAGLRTGLYTSPHVLDVSERIQVDGRNAPLATFHAMLKPHIPWALALPKADRPSWFEWMTVLALEHFRREDCDAVVLETGLGGRLDATNVVAPSVAAITRIDYDHMDILGSTLGLIAREKAGILKPGIPCVLAPQPADARKYIRAVARKVGTPLLSSRSYRGPLALCGAHQRENAGVALGILKALGIPIPATRIRKALATVTLPGRIQILRRDPPRVVDGGHNPLAIRVLARTLREEFPARRWTMILGTADDKDLAGMLQALKGVTSRLVAVGYANPRARDPQGIAEAARRLGMEAAVSSSVRQALKEARGPVCVTGSLWLAGEALAALQFPRQSNRRSPPGGR